LKLDCTRRPARPTLRRGTALRSRLVAAEWELDDPEVWVAKDNASASPGGHVAGLDRTPIRAGVGNLVFVHGQLDGSQAVAACALAHERGPLIAPEQLLLKLPATVVVGTAPATACDPSS